MAVFVTLVSLFGVSAGADVYRCESESGVTFSEKRCGKNPQKIEVLPAAKKKINEAPRQSLMDKDSEEYQKSMAVIERELEFTKELLFRVKKANRAENEAVMRELIERQRELENERAALNYVYRLQLEYHVKRAMDERYEAEQQRKDIDFRYKQLREKLSH